MTGPGRWDDDPPPYDPDDIALLLGLPDPDTAGPRPVESLPDISTYTAPDA